VLGCSEFFFPTQQVYERQRKCVVGLLEINFGVHGTQRFRTLDVESGEKLIKEHKIPIFSGYCCFFYRLRQFLLS
jgi:hypothetical protein